MVGLLLNYYSSELITDGGHEMEFRQITFSLRAFPLLSGKLLWWPDSFSNGRIIIEFVTIVVSSANMFVFF